MWACQILLCVRMGLSRGWGQGTEPTAPREGLGTRARTALSPPTFLSLGFLQLKAAGWGRGGRTQDHLPTRCSHNHTGQGPLFGGTRSAQATSWSATPRGKGSLRLCSARRKTLFYTTGKKSAWKTLVRSLAYHQKAQKQAPQSREAAELKGCRWRGGRGGQGAITKTRAAHPLPMPPVAGNPGLHPGWG